MKGCTARQHKSEFIFIFTVVKIALWGYEPWKWKQYTTVIALWEVCLFLEPLVVQGSWPLFATAETGGAAASATSVWGKLLFPGDTHTGAVETLDIERWGKFCNLISCQTENKEQSAKCRRESLQVATGRFLRWRRDSSSHDVSVFIHWTRLSVWEGASGGGVRTTMQTPESVCVAVEALE